MNNIFKQSKKQVVELDEFFTLSPDGDSGLILTFSEPRKREKVDNKKVKTGETEDFIFEQKYYYPRLNQALSKYLELSQNAPSKTVEELVERTNKLFKIIEEFEKKYKNW
jgi:hypothetical protein